MLQISFFGKDIPVIMPKKKGKFYIHILLITNRYNTKRSHKKDAHKTYTLNIEASRKFSRISCRFIYSQANLEYISVQLLNLQLFSNNFYRFLFPTCFFYILHLGKLLLALNTLIVIPVNLNFFLIQVRTIVLRFFLSQSTYYLVSFN